MGEYLGRIDECAGGIVAGWAFDRDPAGNPVEVEVLVNDEVVAAARADLFREDLRTAGLGDGRHAFQIGVPLTVGRSAPVVVRVRIRGTGMELEGSPKHLDLWSPNSPQRYRAHLDEAEGTRVIGWAVDTHDPARSVDVALYAGDELAGTARCTVERPDVADALGPPATAVCGFVIDVAERFCDGAEREYQLRMAGAPARRSVTRARLSLSRAQVGYVDRLQRGKLVGWAEDPSRTAAVLDVFVDGVFYAKVSADQKRRDGSAGAARNGFEINFGLVPLFGRPIEVDVRFAGTGIRLKRSPFRLDFTRAPKPLPTPAPVAPLDQPISVIVPIHNGFEAVEPCLRALLRHTSPRARILLIDDCSSDPRIGALLAGYGGIDRVLVRRNETNLGYTGTVNLGLSLTGEDDVILLNSDTVVGPRWVENLAVAARSAPDIGTVTAVSDNAGAFSVPESNQDNGVPIWLTSEDASRLVAQASAGIRPQTPTGNGFCMYIRRALLRDIGVFDQQSFPRGYGEENDLCMRAQRAGWQHIVDERTFVRHARSVSFGAEKEGLIARAKSIINARYPDYPVQVERFIESPAMRFVRHRVRGLWQGTAALSRPPRPRILFVLSTRTGGTPQTTRDLLRALRHLYHPLLLTCDAEIIRLFDCDTDDEPQLAEHSLADPIHLAPHTSSEYDAVVRRWLTDHAVELVHIRHIAWHGLDLPRLCRELGIPVVFSFHDFYAICPTVNLIDDTGRFCGAACSPTAGDCTVELWKRDRAPPLKHGWISTWREMIARMLDACDAFVTTSPGAKDMILGTYPALATKSFPVIPHGRDFPGLRERLQLGTELPERTRPIRILCPGNLGVSKGAKLIRALKALDRDNRLEFHFLGDVHTELRDVGHAHGRYDRSDLHARIAEIRPHFAGLFSIWPETFSHTLTEAWASGVPVIASGLGALGERIREHGGGWLLDDLEPEAVYRTILDAAADPDAYMRRLQEIVRWQRLVGRISGTERMAVAYHDLYRACLAKARSRIVEPQPPCLRVGLLAHDSSEPRWSQRWRDWRDHRGFADEVALLPVEIEAVLDMADRGDLDGLLVDPEAVPASQTAALADTCARLQLPLLLTAEGDTKGKGALSAAARAIFSECSTPAIAKAVELPPALPEFAWFGPRGAVPHAVPEKPAETIRLLCSVEAVGPQGLEFLASLSEQLRPRLPVELLVLGDIEAPGPACAVLPVPAFGSRRLDRVHWFRAVAATCDVALGFHSPRGPRAGGPGFLEFAAAGLPGVYSRSGPDSALVEHRTNGFLADNIAGDWLFWLEQLCRDVALRTGVGQAAQETVLARHLMRTHAPAYVAAFRRILGRQASGDTAAAALAQPPRRRRTRTSAREAIPVESR